MRVHRMYGFHDIYLEQLDETNEWFIARPSPCSEAYEVPLFDRNFPGNRLLFIHYPSAKVREPFPRQENVFLSRPVFCIEKQSFAFLHYDFDVEKIHLIKYCAMQNRTEILEEFDFSSFEGLEGVTLLSSPFTLGQLHIDRHRFSLKWPLIAEIELETNEVPLFRVGDDFFTSSWLEHSAYEEFFAIRDITIGLIREKHTGRVRRMPNGTVWEMVGLEAKE